jgi:hypothetical protein
VKTLGNIYENGSRHVTRRVKLTETLNWESVHSVVVEQLPEHELVCESEPARERGEGEAVAEQQPPRALGYEAATSSSGRRLGVVKVLLLKKHQAPLPGAPNDVLHDVSSMESSCLLTLLY